MVTEEKSEIKPNKKQQLCIDKIDGKYLVLAGPGTGKTFTVVHRISAMLEKGINPEKILCLTFSEAAANEMRNKIAKAFGKIDIGVNIYTYHGFCNELIAEHAEEFELSDNYRIITQTISRQFIKECIDEYHPVGYRNTKNDPYVYLKIISDKIQEIKRQRMSKEDYFNNLENHPDWKPLIKELEQEKEDLKSKSDLTKREQNRLIKLDKIIEEKQKDIQKAEEIWEFYELYKAKMESEQYIDFDDMIGLVLDKFETSPAFLDKVANKYEYILVDEYQDTNKSQNEIVFNLVESLQSQNVFVVGDDDQIIYSFQGASLDTVEGFLTKFPETEVICLTENMRSTQSILDVARVIATQDERRLEINPNFKKYEINKQLVAKNKNLIDEKVRLTKYYNKEQEYLNIVDEIETLVKEQNGKNLKEIAILTTSNAELNEFRDLLKDRNIPCEVKDGESIFGIKSSIVLYYYLQFLTNPLLSTDKLLKLLLLPPFNFNPSDYLKLYENLSFQIPMIDKMRQENNWKEPKKIKEFLKTYDELKELSATETVRNIVLETGARTGIFKYFINEETNQNENIAGLKKLVDVAKDFVSTQKRITLEEFIEYLNTIENDKELDILTDKPDIDINAIQLITYHSAKGREFDYVYMPTLQDRKWDKSSKSFKPTIPVSKSEYHDDEYWRLYRLSDRIKTMYVGMTRAKQHLRLSYLENSGATKPCNWLFNIEELVEANNMSETYEDTYLETNKNALIKRAYDYNRDFSSYIDLKLNDRYYSPTAINKYIACPRKFLYEEILQLSGISGNADALHYGSSVHSACEYLVSTGVQTGKYPTKEEFVNKFKSELLQYPLSSLQQRQILEERGEKELSNFYHHLTDTPISSVFATEYKLKTVIDDIKFVGVIDRIEKNSDNTYSIYDYKTGSAKSAKKIAPDEANEDYYNQLCLYKYYFEKTTGETVRDTEIIFVMEHEKKKKIGFLEEDVEEVVNKFKTSINDIESHEFEPTQDCKNCEYCGFKSFCKMNVL